jgi:flagellar basal-body rod protein FlgB
VQLFDVSTVALEKALAGSALRQQVLANNLANANTPGYRRVDVDFHAALAQALGRGDSTAEVDALSFAAAPDGSGPMRYDGSNVDVDREMASLSENALDYQALVATLRARIRMLENVITGR